MRGFSFDLIWGHSYDAQKYQQRRSLGRKRSRHQERSRTEASRDVFPGIRPEPQQSRSSPVGSFGDKLKREREMRAITLEEIAEATKIGTRSLRALEEEHFDQLPGGIFNKGFVRAYAKFLGIDEEQAVADYVTASSDVGNSTTTQLAALADQVEQHRAAKEALDGSSGNTGAMLAVIVGVVLLCGLGFGGYKAWKYKQQQDMNSAAANRVKQTPSPVTLDAQPAPTAASTDVNTPTTDGTTVPSSAPAGATNPSSPVATTTAPPTTNPVPAKDVVAKDATKPATSNTTTTAAPEFPIVVTLKAVKPSWVSATSDGKSVYQQTMSPNDQQLTLHGKEKILLVLGNAAGIEVNFNGKNLGSLGSDGQTRRLTITPQGMQQ
jgi:cytoskeleton protein RodZ